MEKSDIPSNGKIKSCLLLKTDKSLIFQLKATATSCAHLYTQGWQCKPVSTVREAHSTAWQSLRQPLGKFYFGKKYTHPPPSFLSNHALLNVQ